MAMKQPNRKRKLSMDSKEHLNQDGCLVRCQVPGPLVCAHYGNLQCNCIVCVITAEAVFSISRSCLLLVEFYIQRYGI